MPWISAGVSIGGALLNSSNSKSAQKDQDKAAMYQAMMQKKMYDQSRKDNLPWMDRGNEAGNALQQRMGLGADNGSGNYGDLMHSFNNEDFVKDPGYQFRMDEGAKGVEHSAAARGGLLSGAAAKEMERYSQGFASNEFGNAYNRYNQDQSNRFNRLSDISGRGQQSAQFNAQMGMNNAENMNSISQNKANSDLGFANYNNQNQQGMLGNLGGTAYQWWNS